ncbi:hypothetical protein [Brucella tritici]|uniref:hypothetical protein n=1 Tax=Brucella tritici TaxID=94626 RepID=UPI001F452B95|nr:hypothetical protein [Brucella tritici]
MALPGCVVAGLDIALLDGQLLVGADQGGGYAKTRFSDALHRNSLKFADGLHHLFNGQKLVMTVSIGIASEERDNETSDLDIFARADLALDKVKQAGRNGYATRTATVNAPHLHCPEQDTENREHHLTAE